MAGTMLLGPVLFTVVSILFWRFIHAVFVPQLMAWSVFAMFPALRELELVILINMGLIYFGAYFVFGMFWKNLRPHLGNPFLAALGLWLVNVFVVFPLLGRGVLGNELPQGWISASFPLLVSHWMFARGLQFQDRRS